MYLSALEKILSGCRTSLIYLTIFILSYSFFSSVSYAQYDDYCPLQRVKTQFQARLAKTRVYTGTVSGINSYLNNHDRENGEVLAFVQTDYNELFTDLEYSFSYIDMGQGYYCVQLKEVRGAFYAAPALYLPRDYSRNSCEYQEILRHEKRHLQAVYDYHERNKSRYASYLGRLAQSVESYPPVQEEDIPDVQNEIAYMFEEAFREQEIRSLEELMMIQAKIDSPSEYRGVMKRCNNW